MLAAREVIQDSLGFSPNDLVFAHKVRGPLAVLKDNLQESKPPVNLIDYVNGFRHRLVLAWKCASKNLSKARAWMKRSQDSLPLGTKYWHSCQSLVCHFVPDSQVPIPLYVRLQSGIM